MGSLKQRSEGVLCLIGADDTPGLIAEIDRVLRFLEHSNGLSLIDVVFTATSAARRKPRILSIWCDSLSELQQKLSIAQRRLAGGRTHIRDKSGIFYTATPLAAEGKIAFIYPGTGSFHLEMMRDIALTFDGVREAFDDMEEAFADICEVASPSEWLFSTTPGHTYAASESASDFLTILSSASTYLASLVFTNILASVGIRPQAVAGVGLGAFTAYHVLQWKPMMNRVQILRDAGFMLAHLADQGGFEPSILVTAGGVPVEQVEALCAADPDRILMAQRLSPEDCVLCAKPGLGTELSDSIRALGGLSVIETVSCPFNSAWAAPALPAVKNFFKHWVTEPSPVPLYSCVRAEAVKPSRPAVVNALCAQMLNTIDFPKTIRAMYDNGCRIFVEVGARGILSPMIDKILTGEGRRFTTVQMHSLHRSGLVQVGQALGALAANGVPIDYTHLRFFNRAKWLDFDHPVTAPVRERTIVRFSADLPALRPDRVDPRLLQPDTQAAPRSCAPCEEKENRPRKGTDFPFLTGAEVVSHEPEKEITLKRVIPLEDYPYLSDFAIGTDRISLSDPDLKGLTLFAVPSCLEVMAETARRLFPRLTLIRVEHLKAQRWLSFAFDKVALKITATLISDPAGETRSVKVQLRNDAPNTDFTWPMIEATIVLGEHVPEAPAFDLKPLINPRRVDWQQADIYPERLLQGPSLRNIRAASNWAMDGIDYDILMPGAQGTVRYLTRPHFSAMPLLVDAVVSGFSLWRSHERFHGAISLPFRARSIRFYTAAIAEGTLLKAHLRLVNVTPRSHQVDIYVTDELGRLLLLIRGWEEVSGRAKKELHDFVMYPDRNFITQPLPHGILPGDPGGVCGAIYENTTPEFFEQNQELWLKALAYAVLSPTERDDWNEMTGGALRRIEWLHGRVAAKEAVRRYLKDHYNIACASADVTIWKDDLGKPHPLGPWQDQLTAPLDLTIAHTSRLILAAVTQRARIGIDIEQIGRDLSADFLQGVFTIEEQELATRSGVGPTAVLRFWCSKEAVSKALGTGIRYAPTDLRIRKSNPQDGMIHMELMGQWAEHFPSLRGALIPVKTGVQANHAIACCLLPDDRSTPQP